MGKAYWTGFVAAGCLALAGCVEQRVNPADTVALLRTGRPLLDCREACLADWQRVEPQAAQLDAAARWTDLAVLVVGTRYQDDLSLYYLGRAAEGLGYPGAAASYYRQSTRLSGTSISCQNLSRLCGGVVLPRAALFHEAAIEHGLDRLRDRRVRPAARPPSMPEAAPSAAASAFPEPAPNEAVAPPLPLVPEPPSPAPGPPNSDYIEPPPAVR